MTFSKGVEIVLLRALGKEAKIPMASLLKLSSVLLTFWKMFEFT
jgi:hypothetical protein